MGLFEFFLGLAVLLFIFGIYWATTYFTMDNSPGHIHVSYHENTTDEVDAHPGRRDIVAGEYEFYLEWTDAEYFYACVMKLDGILAPRVVHSMVTTNLDDAESWLDERADFLNQTNYTVEKELTS